MTDSGDEASEGSVRSDRVALGIALGLPFGVVLSLLLDNWGMIGVGMAVGVAFGVIPVKDHGAAADGDASADDA